MFGIVYNKVLSFKYKARSRWVNFSKKILILYFHFFTENFRKLFFSFHKQLQNECSDLFQILELMLINERILQDKWLRFINLKILFKIFQIPW